jgi:branched-chain amino acid transport system substrate-binding protein
MSDRARLDDLKDILELLYEKLGAFEKARISSNSKRAKSKFKEIIKYEILPEIRTYEKEYWEFDPQEEIVISDEEATSQLEEVEQAVESIKQIPSSTYPPKLISLLEEIRDKLCEPDEPASAKLKVVLPLIPAIASYELEMETEGLMYGVWQAIREKVRRQQAIPIPPEKLKQLKQAQKNWDKEIKQINSSQQKWWVIGIAIALLTLAGTAGIIYILKQKDATNIQGISLGEEILFDEQDIPIKPELEKVFSDKNYQQSKYLLGDYLEQNPNSPELWVYWNNAKAALLSKDLIKIAVSIPIGTNQDVAEEMLTGVALAQNEFNDRNNETGIGGRLLQIVIANDDNDEILAEQVAKYFVQDNSIIAVVGHNASNATLAAKNIYENKLVMITPTSFSDKIQGYPYIFRMVPQISYFANKLARYIEQENPNSIVGTCLDPGTVDNDSFVAQFEAVFPDKTFKLPCDFLDKGLTNYSSNQEITEVLEEIKQQKINSVVLAPYVSRMPEMSQIIQDIHSKNPSIQLYGSPTFFTPSTLEAGQAVEGFTLYVPWYPDKNKPKNVQFQQQFQQLYQVITDNWRSAMSYDATWTIVKGLEQISGAKQPIKREQLNNALKGIAPYSTFIYDGVVGKTTFSEDGVNKNQSDTLIQIKNGQFTPLRF